VRHAQQKHALLVTVDLPRYSYSLYSACIAPQWLRYFEDQSAFVAHLPQRIRDALIVRMTATDYGWEQASRWRERFPELRVDEGRRPIEELVRQSRVYISTYNATTYLEALTMQVPTVIYWNPHHWELRESAILEFAALKAAGIFHDTPESAATHLAAVWDDIEGWWESPPVAAARRRFVHRYSHLPDDLRERIASALHDAIASAGQAVTQ
jgi:putative transferase (TIGR04331 family)